MTRADVAGTVLDGKLQIERLLASGAGGDVYEALHLGLSTRVAVKILRPGGGEIADVRRRRFLREARVAARLRSPHVVRVFDIVAPEGSPAYIVMELLHGETLAQRLERAGPIPVAEAVAFLGQAAGALGEMHAAGIVHRDVKPSNLFLSLEGGVQTVKLLDFGIAALQQPEAVEGESSITLSAAFVGTPKYMAPEQARSSRDVDARADVWALGVTLYELLAGAPPFDGQTLVAILYQIENDEPKPLRELRPDVPAGLAALVHRCLSRDPARRPADARAFALELAAFDVAAAPVPGLSLRGRSRVGLAMVALVAVVLLLLVGLRRTGEAETVAASPPPQASAAPVELTPGAPPSAAVANAEPVVAAPPPTDPPAVPSSAARPSPAPKSARPGAALRPRPSIGPRLPSRTRPTLQDDDRIE